MSKDSSAKYYQKNKERLLQKRARERRKRQKAAIWALKI